MDHEDQFSLPPAAIRKQLSRILESHALAASDRMARFLRFVVEHSLAGRSGELKEYLIGVEVFDRKQSYDPRVDPIVRVEARRLRAKLAEYYQKDGTADDILVELPKGSYVPRFTRRGDAATSVPSSLSGSGKTPEANAQAQPRTIAVLPFGNVSRDPENDYFSDGLTEELIHALTKVPTLRVVAWNSAVRVRGGERDIYGIGQQLGVETVLMGSVRCDGMRIRILAQLVETKTGFYRWSENYDRDVNEMFAIQEEIARSIVAALQGKLSGDVPRRDYNLQAYNEYLKGRFYWNKRTTDGMRRASTHFEKAIQIDPQFALGYAGLADTYVLLSGYGVAHPAESFHKGRTAALRALSIDPTLGEAECTLGMIASNYDWDWNRGEQHYRRAMALNPGHANTFHWYGVDWLGLRARWAEAFRHIRKALELDPLSPIIRQEYGYLHVLSRDYEGAVMEYHKLLEFDEFFYKAYPALGRVYSLLGRWEDSLNAFERGRELCGDIPSILGALGQTYALAGKTEKARAVLEELHTISRHRHVSATCYAVVHLGLGETECALTWLERGVGQREISLCTIGVHPAYDELRSEPRFQAILQAVGLADVSLNNHRGYTAAAE